MRPGAILQAAIDVQITIDRERRPADQVLRHWARANRYAGSKDRARLAEIIFGVARHRAALTWRMGTDAPRALVLAYQVAVIGQTSEELAALCDGIGHNPAALSAVERSALVETPGDPPPDHIAAEVPGWLWPRVDPRFKGPDASAAMAARATLDIRVNTLKGSVQEGQAHLAREIASLPSAHENPLVSCAYSPVGLRLAPRADGRLPVDLAQLTSYRDGMIEVQDEGAQIVSLLMGARPGDTVVDLCAGGGGKSLALAAILHNRGRLIACDTAPRRLANATERLTRAGATIAETHALDAAGMHPALEGIAADLVLLDVPCSGSGTWRRAPDAKWRLDPAWLETVRATQAALLDRGAALVRPGGRLAYVTCSILPEENAAQTGAFLKHNPAFKPVDLAPLRCAALTRDLPQTCLDPGSAVQLGPHLTGSDGFYLCVMERVTGAGP